MKIIHLLVISTAIICNYLHLCNACTCPGFTTQQKYCYTEFVAIVVIGARYELNDTRIPFLENVIYDITPKAILKGSQNATNVIATSTKLWTNSYGPSCGVVFESGKEYVISGSIVDNQTRLYIYSCDIHAIWSDVGEEERNGLNGGYKCPVSY